jgi:hypothetical protein
MVYLLARPNRHAVVFALTAVAAPGCGGPRARVSPIPATAVCEQLPTPAAPIDSASVVLTSTVRQENAPRPSTSAERFVFAHAYEALLRVDCLGRPTAGLARSWTGADGNARLRLVLRSDARFWNGDAVTAPDVIASWRATGRAPSAVLARRLAEAATAIDDSTLEITVAGLPLVTLGAPELAVTRRVPQSRWAEGTGTYRIRDGARAAPSGANVQMSTLLLEPVGGATLPRLTIHSVGVSDARDLIDTGTDLLFTEDPALASYAARRADTQTLPLTWDRTWVLIAPRSGSVASDTAVGMDVRMAGTAGFRSALARDAVRADARAAEQPRWSVGADSCEASTTATPPKPAARTASRVVYQRGEPVARALAERLVALAVSASSGGSAGTEDRAASLALLAPELARAGARATAVGLAPDDFESALRTGGELAFVAPIPRHSLTPCGELQPLLALAPWLAGSSSPNAAANVAVTLTPLVDTRPLAVVRRDRLGLRVTWDSALVVSPTRTGGAGARP